MQNLTEIVKSSLHGRLDIALIDKITPHIVKGLEEAGAIVLPCDLSRTVYCIAQPCGGCPCYNEPMKEEYIEQCRNCDLHEIIECKFDYDLIPEFGKTVFLTREEAEAKLKEGGKE